MTSQLIEPCEIKKQNFASNERSMWYLEKKINELISQVNQFTTLIEKENTNGKANDTIS